MGNLDLLAALMADVPVIPVGMRYMKPSWMRDALCLEHPEVSFFPGRGESVAPAKGVCSSCIVRDECLAYALDIGWTVFGIWGGTSESERKRLRRQRPAA